MKRNRLFLPLVLLAAHASAQTGLPPAPVPGLITVSGDAEIKMAPDMATIRIGVTSDAKTAKEAQLAATVIANRFLKAAQRILPDPKAYQTVDLSLEPQYTQRNVPGNVPGSMSSEQILTGYRAQNTLVVRLEDIAKVGPLVDAVTEAGATNIDSIAFGLKDDKAARRQALTEAVRQAREKAEAMAAGLGMTLNGVYSVDEGTPVVVRPFVARSMALAAATPVMPGEVSTTASVTVRFYLKA